MQRINYIEFSKEFLIFKLHTLDKSKVKDDFDVIEFEENIKSTNSMEDLHFVCKQIAFKGLKQITTLFNPIKNFFEYLNNTNKDLLDIDTNFIEHYINKICIDMKLSYGTRANYKTTLVSFFTYIDNTCDFEKKFHIKKIKVNSIDESLKPTNKLIDWLDTDTLIRVNKEILNYFKDDSFEKHRDILIFRLFCFSGILPNEMASLTLNSFIFKDSMMFLKIEGNSESKNREIPLPKEKLIRYYNKYIELRNPNAKSFFYNKDNKQIEVNLLSEIVKRLLEFCNVSARDKTPKMLRKTYALFLNNEKGKDGFTQPEQNIKYLLGLANTTQLREILKYGTVDVVTASCVFENLEI